MKRTFKSLLNELLKYNYVFDAESVVKKKSILKELSAASLPNGKELVTYMDALLYASAHPIDEAILKVAQREMKRLATFMKKPAQKYNSRFVNSGLPYAIVRTKFSHDMVRQLLNRTGVEVVLDSFDEPTLQLNDVLKLTLPSSEREITTAGMTNAELLEYLGVKDKQQLPFLVKQLSTFDDQPLVKDHLFDSLAVYVKVLPQTEALSRGFNCIQTNPVFYHNELLKKFDHEQWMNAPMPEPEVLTGDEKSALISAVKNSLILTARETDPSTYMQEDSIRLYRLERGIAVALYGIVPDRQLSFESYVGYTLFKNGWPAAYGGGWVFGRRSLFGINIFEPYRGGESGVMLCHLLRTYKHVFGVDHLEAEPYQYGLDNPEGISSGAFWFYYRYGFRPLDADLKKLAESESQKIKTRPGYRSSEKTLVKFTESNISLSEQKKVPVSVVEISEQITHMIAKKFKGNREEAIRNCTDKLLDLGNATVMDFKTYERRVLEEMALWSGTMKVLDKRKAKWLLELVRLKPVDLYSYQKVLLEGMNSF